jgi:hypothetical protein
VDGGHPGGAVTSGACLDRDPGETLAGGGQAGRCPYLQFRFVVRRQQQEGRIGVEHVTGPFDGALEQAVEVVRGRGADEDLERIRLVAVGVGLGHGCADRGLEDGAFVVADEQTDRGRFAASVADPEV